MFFLQCFHLKLPRPLLHIRTGLVFFTSVHFVYQLTSLAIALIEGCKKSSEFFQSIIPGAINALRDDHMQVFRGGLLINRRTVPRCPFSLVWTCWVSSCVRRPMTVSPFPSDGPERRRRQMPPSQL